MKELAEMLRFVSVIIAAIGALIHLGLFIQGEEERSFKWFVVNILIVIFLVLPT